METVYIETTIVSLLTASPSRDVTTAGMQQATRNWWAVRRLLFDCQTSDETLREAQRGDQSQAEKRLAAPAGLPVMPVTEEVIELGQEFLRTGSLPDAARSDAIHLAAATCGRLDYLLTWNCRHLANAQILRRLEREASRLGWSLPTVCTPFELMGDAGNAIESDS